MAFEGALEDTSDFPAFAGLLADDTRWLVLQHLPSRPDLLDGVRAALSTSADPLGELRALFRHRNHRCHLVAAATQLVRVQPDALEALWATLAGGTWAAPQLAAVAWLTDPDFEPRAQELLQREDAPAKSRAAVGALYRRLPAPSLRVLARLEAPDRADSSARDGSRYAVEWLERLLAITPAEARVGWMRA